MTTGTVTANGVETYYERRGAGPAIVFVHGAVMDHSQWRPQLDALAGEFTVVAYDVRGHGRTGGTPPASYSVDLYAEDLAALVDALDLDRPVVCGLSLGGCIAQVYAARHPEAVSGLVLADTFTPDMASLSDRLQFGMLRATILPVRLFGYPRVQRFQTWVQEQFSRGARGNYAEIERLQAEAPDIPADEFAKVIRSLTAFPGTAVDYDAIDVPTAVLYGEAEPAFVRRHAATLAASLPHATIQAVPDAGHASNVDNPAFFTDTVRDLARRVRDDTSERAGED